MVDPAQLSDLAALPWQMQLIFASGYCAYLLAFVGLRHTHKAADTVFGTLAFGLVALAISSVIPNRVPWLFAASAVFLGPLVVAVLWRWKVRKSVRKAMRLSDYSWSDDTPRAWDRLLECDFQGTTQLTVELDDGRKLLCTEAARVGAKPYGPFVLGTAGDVLLYADHIETADGKLEELDYAFDESWGDLLTYVPADKIRKLSIRVS